MNRTKQIYQYFKPCELIFPNWPGAKSILKTFLDQMDFDLKVDSFKHSLHIYFQTPMIQGRKEGELIPMYMTFPEDERKIVLNILDKSIKELLFFLDDHTCEPITKDLKLKIKGDLESKQAEIISRGGPSMKDKIYHRLGILSN